MLGLDRALMVATPWAFLLVDGVKVWEIRRRDIKYRGRVAIALVGSGTLIGEVEIIDSFFMSVEELRMPSNVALHKLEKESDLLEYVGSEGAYVVVVKGGVRYPTPVQYEHNQGAQLFVRLDRPETDGRLFTL